MDGLEQPLQRGRSRFRYSLPTLRMVHSRRMSRTPGFDASRCPINESRINIWWSRIANPNIRDWLVTPGEPHPSDSMEVRGRFDWLSASLANFPWPTLDPLGPDPCRGRQRSAIRAITSAVVPSRSFSPAGTSRYTTSLPCRSAIREPAWAQAGEMGPPPDLWEAQLLHELAN